MVFGFFFLRCFKSKISGDQGGCGVGHSSQVRFCKHPGVVMSDGDVDQLNDMSPEQQQLGFGGMISRDKDGWFP